MQTRRHTLDVAGCTLRARYDDVRYVRAKHGYAFLCDGIKFGVNGSAIRTSHRERPRFFFTIRGNMVPDVFLLLGFAEKMLMWIIPACEINTYRTLAFGPADWSEYREEIEEKINVR